jgi:N-hydroxyarylamine O-acetyltransferase
MHTHDELPVQPPDLLSGHHYTSTFPASHFRNLLMLTKHVDGAHVSLTHRTLTVRRAGEPTEHREIEVAELRERLHELAVPLTDEEEARLLARVEQLRAKET